MTKEECLQTKCRLEDFVDNVSESVNLHQQLDKPVPILDYALQKVSMWWIFPDVPLLTSFPFKTKLFVIFLALVAAPLQNCSDFLKFFLKIHFLMSF